MSTGLTVAIQALEDGIEASETRFAVEMATAEDRPDRQDLAVMLSAIRDARARLADFAREVEQMLLAEAGERSFLVDGLGEVEVKRQTRRTRWRYDELVPQVISRLADEPEILFDPGTGERLPWVQTAHLLGARLRDCFSFSAKVTGLRALGLQIDEWCIEESDGYSVKLPGRAA